MTREEAAHGCRPVRLIWSSRYVRGAIVRHWFCAWCCARGQL